MTTDERLYVWAVLAAYVSLPDSPRKPRPFDRDLALRLCREHVPLPVVLAAFTLARARRASRSSSAPPLPPVRSLAYFRPVIDDLIGDPPSPEYLAYLSRAAAPVQIPAFRRDR